MSQFLSYLANQDSERKHHKKQEMDFKFGDAKIELNIDLIDYEESKVIADGLGIELFKGVYYFEDSTYKLIGFSSYEGKKLLVSLCSNLSVSTHTYLSVFENIPITRDSRFCNHKVGDHVICIAKGRYKGVKFNEINLVTDIRNGRLEFNGYPKVTYDPIYFLVLQSKNNTTDSLEGKKSSRNKGESDKKRELVDVEPIIQRKKLINFKFNKRVVIEPNLIERKKLNK